MPNFTEFLDKVKTNYKKVLSKLENIPFSLGALLIIKTRLWEKN